MAIDTTKLAPFSSAIAGYLTHSMTHVASAWVETPSGEVAVLDLTADSTVSWDETRAPRVLANLVCKAPTDAALLARLDPRTGARVKVMAGYQRPDGAQETALIADLVLRSRRVTRPADRMIVQAASDESLIIDGAATRSGSITNATTTGAMTAIIQQLLPGVVPAVSGTTGPAVSATLFDDRWTVINDLADRIGAQVYDNGLRQWVIAPAPAATTPAWELAVGANGTITDSDAGLTRDDGWGNYIWLRYEWTDGGGVARTMDGLRQVTSGPFAAGPGNYKVVKVVRTGVSATQAEANAAAAALVARMATRGRTFQVSAISAYWLRPGHTVDVSLPLGETEAHLVTAVTFDLAAGTMQVTTRLPDNTLTIGA